MGAVNPSGSGVLANSFVGTSTFQGMQGLEPQQQLVFKVIQQGPNETGVWKTVIHSSLKGKMSVAQIE